MLAIAAMLAAPGCQSIKQHEQQRRQEALHRDITLDRARIFITTGDLDNPHEKLGDLSFSEPLNAQTMDSDYINKKLRHMANAKWGNQVDALIHLKTKINADATSITASAVAVRVKGDCNFCRHNFIMPTH